MAQSSKSSVKNVLQSSDTSPRTPALVEQKSVEIADAYILGIGEHPDLSLIFVPLNSTNYMSWRHDVLTSLATKGNEGFILKTLPKPMFGELEYNL